MGNGTKGMKILPLLGHPLLTSAVDVVGPTRLDGMVRVPRNSRNRVRVDVEERVRTKSRPVGCGRLPGDASSLVSRVRERQNNEVEGVPGTGTTGVPGTPEVPGPGTISV